MIDLDYLLSHFPVRKCANSRHVLDDEGRDIGRAEENFKLVFRGVSELAILRPLLHQFPANRTI